MSFLLTESQTALRDLVRRSLIDARPFGPRMAEDQNVATVERALADLGVFELFDDPSIGAAEFALLAAESGRTLLPVPLTERLLCGVYIPRLLAEAGAEVPNDIFDTRNRERIGCATVDATAQGGTISTLQFVAGAADASFLAVLPRDASSQVLLYGRGDYAIQPAPSLDLTLPRFSVAPTGTPRPLAPFDNGRLGAFRSLALAAEVQGAVARAVEMTVDYVKTRKQFGVPIGGFQAVQHKLADLYLFSESLRALVQFAAWSAENSREQFLFAASAARCHALEGGAGVVEGAIQLHGGIGFTWEYPLHHFLRRIKSIELLNGDSEMLQVSLRDHIAAEAGRSGSASSVKS